MSNENGNSRRREALLGDRPGSYAIARHVRMRGESFIGPQIFMVKQMSGLWYWANSSC